MLECQVLSSPDHKNSHLPFLEDEVRFVVADLESKLFLRNQIQEIQPGVTQARRVTRASELWFDILRLQEPRWQVIDTAVAQLLIEKWMTEILRESPRKLSAKDAGRAYQTIGQILPLLCHWDGEAAIAEWFEQTPDARERWFDWYEVGRELWARFQKEMRIPEDWVKALLINIELPTLGEDRFVFDLGLDLDDLESELILNLSRTQSVLVIVPEVCAQKEVYQSLLARNEKKANQEISLVAPKSQRYATMLAEVKQAVALCRQWLDEGIPAQEIGVTSPVIENYWPTLYEHFLVEGIPTQKSVVTPLSQIEIYQGWLSKMRVALSTMDSSDGLQIFFSGEQDPSVPFDEYSKHFSNVYDRSDFSRLVGLEEELPEAADPRLMMTFSDFAAWFFSLIPKSQYAEFSNLMSLFDGLFLMPDETSLHQWVSFFEESLSRQEKILFSGTPDGIGVLSLNGVVNRPLKKCIILGLAEENLVESRTTALLWSDIESIKLNFGFQLPHADDGRTLEKLQWIQKKGLDELIFSTATTDFNGRDLAPSVFWLQAALEEGVDPEKVHIPRKTRWDQVQNGRAHDDAQLAEQPWIDNGIHRDQGQREWGLKPLNEYSLSASSINNYLKCPFIFFAIKGLHLDDSPSI
ncbi:MAG: hypothetical protein AAF203_08745, partial [Pseudomonadota bacterium]